MGLKIEDLEKITFVSDPKISPDGKKVAFVTTKPSISDNKYYSKLWIYDIEKDEYYHVTNGPSDFSPFWTGDSNKILFLSRRSIKENEEGLELWVLDLKNKTEPRLVFKYEKGFQIFGHHPSKDKVLISLPTLKKKEEIKIIDEVPFWFNGQGYIYGERNALYFLDLNNGNLEKLTEGNEEIGFAQISPDGKKIAYISAEDHMRPYKTDIKLINLQTGEVTKLTQGQFSIEDLAWDPNSSKIAFRASDFTHGLNSHIKLWIMDLSSGQIKKITLSDWDIANNMNSDVRGPSSQGKLQWSEKWLYFPFNRGRIVSLYRTDGIGRIEPAVEGEFTVEDFTSFKDRVALTIMSSTRPAELYIYENKELRKVTSFNDEVIEKAKIQAPEYFRFTASDGNIIDGWVLKPTTFKEGEKYPAILYIHGGPATAYGESFMHEFHVLSDAGFAVIYFNPRGSAGYTEDFKDMRGKYGTRDYQDLMEGLDYAIKNFSFIDENRLGVAGGSYGGFMTNWIIGHTNRFKAAVTQRSISNWISFYGTSDIGYYFAEDQIGGDLGKDLWTGNLIEVYWDRSPLKYVNNVKTPTLILHSDEDYRCWIDQAYQLFTALKLKGVETKLVIFPGENHELSRKGKPKNRVERLNQIVSWFKKYL
ncbi:prolyl oligopeptidase family serine peptidase [Fervidicoccus fontis]|uniref:S9 family peptidase n=1 Tax=Fervidicoccus fontis TaxID=683846 RepID=A0A7C2ZTV6_9CREN|nr:S9 family peptidase [Fervidicoccus fontis]HEW64311.1 S9 family peptidase [Fervidicoccus fontis]